MAAKWTDWVDAFNEFMRLPDIPPPILEWLEGGFARPGKTLADTLDRVLFRIETPLVGADTTAQAQDLRAKLENLHARKLHIASVFGPAMQSTRLTDGARGWINNQIGRQRGFTPREQVENLLWRYELPGTGVAAPEDHLADYLVALHQQSESVDLEPSERLRREALAAAYPTIAASLPRPVQGWLEGELRRAKGEDLGESLSIVCVGFEVPTSDVGRALTAYLVEAQSLSSIGEMDPTEFSKRIALVANYGAALDLLDANVRRWLFAELPKVRGNSLGEKLSMLCTAFVVPDRNIDTALAAFVTDVHAGVVNDPVPAAEEARRTALAANFGGAYQLVEEAVQGYVDELLRRAAGITLGAKLSNACVGFEVPDSNPVAALADYFNRSKDRALLRDVPSTEVQRRTQLAAAYRLAYPSFPAHVLSWLALALPRAHGTTLEEKLGDLCVGMLVPATNVDTALVTFLTQTQAASVQQPATAEQIRQWTVLETAYPGAFGVLDRPVQSFVQVGLRKVRGNSLGEKLWHFCVGFVAPTTNVAVALATYFNDSHDLNGLDDTTQIQLARQQALAAAYPGAIPLLHEPARNWLSQQLLKARGDDLGEKLSDVCAPFVVPATGVDAALATFINGLAGSATAEVISIREHERRQIFEALWPTVLPDLEPVTRKWVRTELRKTRGEGLGAKLSDLLVDCDHGTASAATMVAVVEQMHTDSTLPDVSPAERGRRVLFVEIWTDNCNSLSRITRAFIRKSFSGKGAGQALSENFPEVSTEAWWAAAVGTDRDVARQAVVANLISAMSEAAIDDEEAGGKRTSIFFTIFESGMKLIGSLPSLMILIFVIIMLLSFRGGFDMGGGGDGKGGGNNPQQKGPGLQGAPRNAFDPFNLQEEEMRKGQPD